MTDLATKPKQLTSTCPECGGTNVRSTIAQAAEGRPGPNGKPVKAGQSIHECGDCGAIVNTPKPAAKTKAKAKAKAPAKPSRPRGTRSTSTERGGTRRDKTTARRGA